eukprot:jgi/Ulvmu1/7396/UM036_0056.1
MALASYRGWLRRNEVLVQCLEGLVEHASWLLPDRFSSLEGPVELCRSLSGALSVFNGHMLANAAPSSGNFLLSMIGQFEVLVEMAAQRLESGGQIHSKYTILLMLEAFKVVTKLNTLFTQRPSSLLHGGISDAQEEATFQEQLSAALRAMHDAASALSASQHRIDGVSGRGGESAYSHNHTAWWRTHPSAMCAGASQYSPTAASPVAAHLAGAPATPMTPDDASTAGSRPPVSPLGTARSPRDIGRPTRPHTPPVLPPPGPPWGHRRHAASAEPPHVGPRPPRGRPWRPTSDAARLRQRVCRVLRMGETLAAVRPLLYVALLRRFGPRSWLPWTLALACEALALTLTTMASRVLRKLQSEHEAAQTCAYSGTSAGALYTLLWPQPVSRTDAELRRRRWQLALYLLRDPFYRQLLWPQLHGACRRLSGVRVLGGLAGRMFEILDGMQQYYVYTSGS